VQGVGNRIVDGDLRPVSGHVSAMVVLMLLTREYDSIMSLSLRDGGCPGYTTDFLPSKLNLRVHKIPFDHERFRIDIDACEEQNSVLRPDLVIIGPCFALNTLLASIVPLSRISSKYLVPM